MDTQEAGLPFTETETPYTTELKHCTHSAEETCKRGNAAMTRAVLAVKDRT